MLAVVAYLAVLQGLPFRFQTDSNFVLDRLDQFQWVPFLDYYQGDYLRSFETILSKTILFGVIGVVAGWPGAGRWKVSQTFLAALFLTLGLTAVRLLQPSHHPSVSDLLIQPFGAVAGWLAVRKIDPSHPIAPEPRFTYGYVR